MSQILRTVYFQPVFKKYLRTKNYNRDRYILLQSALFCCKVLTVSYKFQNLSLTAEKIMIQTEVSFNFTTTYPAH